MLDPFHQVIPSSTRTSSSSDVSPQPKSSYHPHLIGFITLVIVFGLGYFFGTKQLNHLEPVPSPIVSASPIVSIDSTANLKIYTDTKYQYELNYTSNWKEIQLVQLSESPSDNYLYQVITSSDRDVKKLENLYPDPFLGIYIQPVTPTNTFKEWVNHFSSFQDGNGIANVSTSTLFNMQVTIVEGKPTLNIAPGSWYIKIYLFQSPDSKNNFAIMVADTENKNKKKDFDQILSTFRFLDDEKADTANWHTYKFSGFSLSFKYPDTLKLDELDIKDRPAYYKDSPYVMLADNNASMTITPNGVGFLGFESSDYETVDKRVEVNGSNVEISGNPIFKTRILYKPTGSISYFISMQNPDNDSQFVSISYKATSGDVSLDSQQIFDQILSTFKFLP